MPLYPYVCTVIADYLRHIAAFAISSINRGGMNVTAKHVHWVLTVPANWSQESKLAMRQAAISARMVRGPDGIDNGGSAHNLIIALEPEAASVFCFSAVENKAVKDLLYVRALPK